MGTALLPGRLEGLAPQPIQLVALVALAGSGAAVSRQGWLAILMVWTAFWGGALVGNVIFYLRSL